MSPLFSLVWELGDAIALLLIPQEYLRRFTGTKVRKPLLLRVFTDFNWNSIFYIEPSKKRTNTRLIEFTY